MAESLFSFPVSHDVMFSGDIHVPNAAAYNAYIPYGYWAHVLAAPLLISSWECPERRAEDGPSLRSHTHKGVLNEAPGPWLHLGQALPVVGWSNISFSLSIHLSVNSLVVPVSWLNRNNL